MEDSVPRALIEDYNDTEGVKPTFQPKAEKFTGGCVFCEVKDGWIFGFNEGERG